MKRLLALLVVAFVAIYAANEFVLATAGFAAVLIAVSSVWGDRK